MKRFIIMAVAALALLSSCSQYKYETVKGDPLGTKIYTLDNGLKVYMSVNKETPRIQTYIAVKVGGKNDPSETTGLAHYFEHLMFKGSQNFGTTDYAAEKPLLDEIEALLLRERKNAEDTIPIVEADSSIGFEGSMLYMCDKAHLEWKIRHTDYVLNIELGELRGGVRAHKEFMEKKGKEQ